MHLILLLSGRCKQRERRMHAIEVYPFRLNCFNPLI